MLAISDLVFVMLATLAFYERNLNGKSKIALLSFICGLLTFLVMFRPIGTSADDYYYIQMAKDASYFDDATFFEYYDRDPFYYWVLKSLAPFFGERSLTVMAGGVFFVKYLLILALSRSNFFALYFYFCLSFYLHDIVQLRLAMAVMFMLLGVLLISKARHFVAGVSSFFAYFSHSSAAVSIFLFARYRWRKFLFFSPVILAVLLQFGMPSLPIQYVSYWVESLANENVYVTRYLIDENRLIDANFNTPTLVFYLTFAFYSKAFIDSVVSRIGVFFVNLSVLSVVIFQSAIAFAVRLNELFMTFSILSLGLLREDEGELSRLILIISGGLFYLRSRWIDLIFYG